MIIIIIIIWPEINEYICVSAYLRIYDVRYTIYNVRRIYTVYAKWYAHVISYKKYTYIYMLKNIRRDLCDIRIIIWSVFSEVATYLISGQRRGFFNLCSYLSSSSLSSGMRNTSTVPINSYQTKWNFSVYSNQAGNRSICCLFYLDTKVEFLFKQNVLTWSCG